MADARHYAITRTGQRVLPESLDEATWQFIKDNYAVGDFRMPCCPDVPAIPKTGPNGTRFFAHLNGGCETAPESVWHQSAKALLCHHLSMRGIQAAEEVKGHGWKADVFFTHSGRPYVFEVQHSYQNLRDYRMRQARYVAAGVQSFWVLYKPCYKTLLTSIVKWRLRNEFGGKLPSARVFPFLPDLPMVCLDVDPSTVIMGGTIHPTATLAEFIEAILYGRFQFQDGRWQVL
jgi:hypothetical protein